MMRYGSRRHKKIEQKKIKIIHCSFPFLYYYLSFAVIAGISTAKGTCHAWRISGLKLKTQFTLQDFSSNAIENMRRTVRTGNLI